MGLTREGGVTVGLLYDRAVRRGGPHVALVQPGGDAWTYERLGDGARRLHRAWRMLGIGHSDRVALWMPNCCEYVVTEYSVARAGATRVPIAKTASDDDVVDALNRTSCVALVHSRAFAERVRGLTSRLESVRHFVAVGATGADPPAVSGEWDFSGLLESHAPLDEAEDVDPEQLAAIYFTGGTTGRPKGVMLSHRALVETYRAAITELGIGWQERFLVMTPLTHASGYLAVPVLMRGGRCVLADQFRPDAFLKLVASEGATSTFLVPTMIGLLLDQGNPDGQDLSTLTNVIYGASAISPHRMRQALQRFGPIFTQLYGQTEAPMTILVLPRAAHMHHDAPADDEALSAAGWPTSHTELRTIDDDGHDVPAGSAGEVIVRATNLMSGYLDDPKATAETIRDGWLHTGDVGKQDGTGRVTITDRKKDVIVSGGFNVSPREVEDVLVRHGDVVQAVVVGTPDEKWGEQVTAVIVLRPNSQVTEEDLIALVKEHKGSVVAPKRVIFRDTIPVTSLGKIDRKALRDEFWRGRARMV